MMPCTHHLSPGHVYLELDSSAWEVKYYSIWPDVCCLFEVVFFYWTAFGVDRNCNTWYTLNRRNWQSRIAPCGFEPQLKLIRWCVVWVGFLRFSADVWKPCGRFVLKKSGVLLGRRFLERNIKPIFYTLWPAGQIMRQLKSSFYHGRCINGACSMIF